MPSRIPVIPDTESDKLSLKLDKRLRVHERSFPQIRNRKKRRFLQKYSECGVLGMAATHAGIARDTEHYWRRTDKQYRECFEEARLLAIESLEDEATKRATREKSPSDILLIFLLKAAAPERYRDNYKREDSEQRPLINIDLRGLPLPTLELLLNRIRSGEITRRELPISDIMLTDKNGTEVPNTQ